MGFVSIGGLSMRGVLKGLVAPINSHSRLGLLLAGEQDKLARLDTGGRIETLT